MSQNRWVLFIVSESAEHDALSDRARERLVAAISDEGYELVRAGAHEDALSLVHSDPSYSAILLDWDLEGTLSFDERAALNLIRAVRVRNERVPIFLIADRSNVSDLPLEVVTQVHEYVHIFNDTPAFIANRVDAAVESYHEQLLPPYFRELVKHSSVASYNWDAPGHMGGAAFLKHPIGMEFYRFYGENLFRADLGIATSGMGSWLDHLGPPGDSERNAARIFNADWTFFVLGGGSAANRIVGQVLAVRDDLVLVDMNCHRSVCQTLAITGARPIRLRAPRNGFGMVGLIPLKTFSREALQSLIAESNLDEDRTARDPRYATVTNSTYDGLCYDIDRVVETLSQSVARIHFDEAWVAHAKFHDLYLHRYAMGVSDEMEDRPLILAAQSTHKVLGALSMGAMIHVKLSPRAIVDYDQFNQAFMMHGTTSPSYPILSSLDVAAAMMDRPAGPTLVKRMVHDAIEFRQAMASVARRLRTAGQDERAWFFRLFQPEFVTDPTDGKIYTIDEAPVDLLQAHSSCWTLKQGQDWHGYRDEDIADEYCMLDPTKVTILMPGINAQGEMADWGIPAAILADFLNDRHVDISRVGDYTVLLLFSIGTTHGKWGALMKSLLEFKRRYDTESSLEETLPSLVSKFPSRYRNITLKELSDEMHHVLLGLDIPYLVCDDWHEELAAVLTPQQTYETLVRGQTEKIRLQELAGRIAAVSITPYPPGIPMCLGGERFGSLNSPALKLLFAYEEFAMRFPGFEREIHGIEVDANGMFWTRAVIE